jgi:hypothetical protein
MSLAGGPQCCRVQMLHCGQIGKLIQGRTAGVSIRMPRARDIK